MPEKKIIYVAGPYRAPMPRWVKWLSRCPLFRFLPHIWTLPGRILNIWRARRAAIRLWRQGWVVICPHLNSALMDGACDESAFLEGDIELLKRCHAIFMLTNWIKSTGAKSEHRIALADKKQIFYESSNLEVKP
jgi:hypothetical protein